jgi:signal peptidase I
VRNRLATDALIGLGAAAAIVAAVAGILSIQISGTSMSPTLTSGDSLLADKVLIHWMPPSRGDLVEIVLPNGVHAVKRLIGMPGDAIEIDGSTATAKPQVLVKPGNEGAWQVLEEPYVAPGWVSQAYCCDDRGHSTSGPARPFVVPAGAYYVMGDNRNVSEDSRAFGPVTRARLLGRVLFRYWPAGSIAAGFQGTRLSAGG